MAYIDNYARPGNPVVDITGNPLGLLLNFEDKGASSQTEHPIANFTSVIPASQAGTITALATTPLNQFFDQAWSQNTDQNGQTMRDRTNALIVTQIQSGVSQIGSGFSAYNIGVNLPATGILRSIVLNGSTVLLSYELSGVSAGFTVTTPFTGGLIPDPTYTLTFDIELLAEIDLPLHPGPITTKASFNVENANISASNPVASLGDAVLTAFNFLSGQPTNIFQGPEGEIDSSGGPIGNLGQLSALPALFTSIAPVAFKLGLLQLNAFIDPNARVLNIQLTHPIDPSPVVINAADPPFPSLFGALIAPSSTEVHAGDTVGVTATNFPIGQASNLYIGWTDTTSGLVTESDILWGPVGGTQTIVTKVRNGQDGGNTFTASGLPPNAPLSFSVRDQDFLTETPFSAPLTITTAPTDQVDLLIGQTAPQTLVGTALLTATGTFTTTIQIPPNLQLVNTTYTLYALLGGQILATAQLSIFALGQSLPLTIEVIDPNSGITINRVEQTMPFILTGQGFQPGAVSIFIDTVGGQSLGTAISDNQGNIDASLQWPISGGTGTHQIIAQEIIGNQALVASVSVVAEPLPQ